MPPRRRLLFDPGAGTASIAFGVAVRCLAIALIAPQIGSSDPGEFDVVSIRPNLHADGSSSIQFFPNGRWVANNVTVASVIMNAFGVRRDQVLNLPSWAERESFDIQATAEPDGSDRRLVTAQRNQRLRALLASRFGLVVRHEKKELTGLLLVVDKNGPKLKPASATDGFSKRMSNGRLEFTGTIDHFAADLSNALAMPVVNQTALTGTYDIVLEFGPADAMPTSLEGGDAGGVSLFTALQQQLGLRLERKTMPVPIVVVEKLTRPSDN